MIARPTQFSSFSFLISLFFIFSFNTVEAKAFTVIGGEEFPKWFVNDPFLDLTDFQNRDEAKSKKGLMVLYTTKGCSYCAEFIHKSLGDDRIAALVRQDFDSVGLEIFDDVEMVDPSGETLSVKQFAKKEKVEFAPTLLFYDNEGKRVLHQTGYQSPDRFRQLLAFVAKGHYKTQSLRDFFNNKNNNTKAGITKSAYKLKADPLFGEAPYLLDRSHFSASEPMLVIFEKSACDECEQFHNAVLSKDVVRKTLKDFEVVRLDANDNTTTVLMPNGEKLTPAQWYTKTKFSRLPALLFFDEKGNNVLSTDALVLEGRMMSSLGFMQEKAYQKGWTYQQFARSKSIERNLKEAKKND